MLAEIEIKVAITETLYRYCRALDRMDRDLADSVWHSGATAEYGEGFKGSAADVMDQVWVNHAKLEGHSHQITNVLIEAQDGRATSEAYVTAYLWCRTDAGQLLHVVVVGRYLDIWSYRVGKWAIDARVFVDDTRFVHQPTPPEAVTQDAMSSALGQLASGRNAHESVGRRDRTDPSYDLLKSRID